MHLVGPMIDLILEDSADLYRSLSQCEAANAVVPLETAIARTGSVGCKH